WGARGTSGWGRWPRYHRRQGEGFRRPTAVHVARLHVGLLHRCPAGHSWIPQAGDPDGFHVTAGDHRVHGRHGGRDHAATAQGHPRHDALTTKKVSAFVVGAITLIVAPFAVPSASFTRDIGRAVAECAEHDGGHGRGEAEAAREVGDRRGRSGTRGGSEDAEVEEEEEREHREGGAARRGGERGEKVERERGGERQGDDVATLTCGAHVGPMLTQLSRRTKQG
uniref:Uncharacterized protein n=1 Tax=Oryza glaberrima TaxID=4538 RepID=I1Q0S1_ORYGL